MAKLKTKLAFSIKILILVSFRSEWSVGDYPPKSTWISHASYLLNRVCGMACAFPLCYTRKHRFLIYFSSFGWIHLCVKREIAYVRLCRWGEGGGGPYTWFITYWLLHTTLARKNWIREKRSEKLIYFVVLVYQITESKEIAELHQTEDFKNWVKWWKYSMENLIKIRMNPFYVKFF